MPTSAKRVTASRAPSFAATPRRGYTTPQFARFYRIGLAKVFAWIASGDLAAINIAAKKTGRPRWLITPEAIEKFELSRMREVGQ